MGGKLNNMGGLTFEFNFPCSLIHHKSVIFKHNIPYFGVNSVLCPPISNFVGVIPP